MVGPPFHLISAEMIHWADTGVALLVAAKTVMSIKAPVVHPNFTKGKFGQGAEKVGCDQGCRSCGQNGNGVINEIKETNGKPCWSQRIACKEWHENFTFQQNSNKEIVFGSSKNGISTSEDSSVIHNRKHCVSLIFDELQAKVEVCDCDLIYYF